jgi:hypothetical protein
VGFDGIRYFARAALAQAPPHALKGFVGGLSEIRNSEPGQTLSR